MQEQITKLNDTQYYHLSDIFAILGQFSKNSFLVGGCVRDFSLGKVPKDFDVVTDVPMATAKKAFEASDWKVKETGESFLVLSISKDSQQYEVANFRKDGVYLDGRRPSSVEIGTLQEDAERRDFTVNALYWNFLTGEVLDPLGTGLDDLKTKLLRFIGRPKDRIREDYLRVFRYYRFLKKGFTPHPKSMRACREMFNEAYQKTTPERVRAELEKML